MDQTDRWMSPVSNAPLNLQQNRNAVIGVAVFIFVAFLCIWLSARVGSTAGEISGALSSFIGGVVGAVGAILAVYLALSAQRKEETRNVSDAVRIEVTTLVKYIIRAIKVCEEVADGERRIPRQDAR